MIKRQQIRVNKELLDSFKERAFAQGVTQNKRYIKPLIDVLMNCYTKGMLDRFVEDFGIVTNPLQGKRVAVQLNKEIKGKFGEKAVKDNLITKKIHASFLVEIFMEEYIFGRLDKLINTEYDEWRKKRNRKIW